VTTARADGVIAFAPTLRAAAPHQRERRDGDDELALRVAPEDLRVRRREPPAGHVVLFIVDASGSMAAERRMAIAKGAALSMLAHAYQRRDHVGLIAFRGAGADLILPPTRSVEHAERRLHDLLTGGRTPLAHALRLARDVLARPAYAGHLPVLVVLSDGRANVPMAGGAPLEEAYAEARTLRDAGVRALVLDSETGPVRLGLAQRLATALGADYRPLDGLDMAVAEQTVRAALPDLFTAIESAVPHAD
jgi:magnesium chelatase subunit D